MFDSPLVGIVSPPGWYDPTASEFASLCDVPIRTQQALVAVPDLNYDDLDCIAKALPEVQRAAYMLGLTGTDAIAMTGTPFVWAGLQTEADIRVRLESVTKAATCPVVMAGTAIIDALRALGARRIAVATPYYTTSWRNQTALILSDCGFDICSIKSADQMGLAPPIKSISEHHNASGDAVLSNCLQHLREECQNIDALVVIGAGVRTLKLTTVLEPKLEIPIVSSDTALYWALAQTLNVRLQSGQLGRMEKILG